MENPDNEDIITPVSILLIAAEIQQYRRNRFARLWVRPWIARRNQYGAYHALVQEWSSEDPSGLKNVLRMEMATFNELLEMVTPIIKRRDTLMRDSISPAERLAFTLSFFLWDNVTYWWGPIFLPFYTLSPISFLSCPPYLFIKWKPFRKYFI